MCDHRWLHKLDCIVCEAIMIWLRCMWRDGVVDCGHRTWTYHVFTKNLLFSTLETPGTPCSTWTGSRRTAGRLWPATRRSGRGMLFTSSLCHHRILWIFSVLMIAAVTATVAQVRPQCSRDWSHQWPPRVVQVSVSVLMAGRELTAVLTSLQAPGWQTSATTASATWGANLARVSSCPATTLPTMPAWCATLKCLRWYIHTILLCSA